MTAPIRPGRILADDELLPAVRAGLAGVHAPYDPADLDEDTDNPEADLWAERAHALANRVGDLLAWLDENGIDPAAPPLCGCGGQHWSCPGPGADAEAEEEDPEVCRQCCTETEGLTDVQGTLLCQGCIAYNVSRCM